MTRLPERGRSRDDVLGELDAMRTRDVAGGTGAPSPSPTTPATTSSPSKPRPTTAFMDDNALNTDAFPSLQALQSDVVGMVPGWSTAGRRRPGS